MTFKAAFILTARDKQKFVYRAAASALAQTYPCHILLSDQGSKDETYAEMARAVKEAPRGAEHKVDLVRCPIEGPYSMRSCNAHIMWCVEQCEEEWIFQCSADDYSLPERVAICMAAAEKNNCAGVACTMKFEDPAKPGEVGVSGYPTQDGYVAAGIGMTNMAFGSTIWGYKKKFLEKVGSAGDSTADVFYGFLAALDEGYYVVANPQHVHVLHAALDNMGFQGKMRAAEEGSDDAYRLAELNRFQLFELYSNTAHKMQEKYPLAHATDRNAIINMLLAQAEGWMKERKNLHDRKITPGMI